MFIEGSSEEIIDMCGVDVPLSNVSSQRNNTSLHVCWHRAATITLKDQLMQAEVSILLYKHFYYFHKHILKLSSYLQNQLSGYLLRKFKNSAGWQKLWVVFTSFCLYFYKTYQDEAPLASLPLLG